MHIINLNSKFFSFLLLTYLFIGYPFSFPFSSTIQKNRMYQPSSTDSTLFKGNENIIRLNIKSTRSNRDDNLITDNKNHQNNKNDNYNKEEILDKVMIAAMDVRYRGLDECDPIELLMGLSDVLDDLTDAELGVLIWSLGVAGVRMAHLEKVQTWRKLDIRIAKLDVTSEYNDYGDDMIDIKQQLGSIETTTTTTSGSGLSNTNTNMYSNTNTKNNAYKYVSSSSITMDLFKGMNDMRINWSKFSKGSKFVLDQRIYTLLEQMQISNSNSNKQHDRSRTFLTLVNVLGNMKVSFDELSERSQKAFLYALEETAQSPPALFSVANTIMSLGRMKLRVDGHLSLSLRKAFRSILRSKLPSIPRSSFWKVLVGLADMGFQWTSLDVRTRMALQQELMRYDVFHNTRSLTINSTTTIRSVDVHADVHADGNTEIATQIQTQTPTEITSTIKSGRYTDYVSYKEVGVMLHSLSRFNAQWSNMDAGSRQGILAGVKGTLMVMPARELSQAISCMGSIGLTWDTLLENDNNNNNDDNHIDNEEEYYISIINSKVPLMGGWDLVEGVLGLGRMGAPPRLIAPNSPLEKLLIQKRKFVGAPLAGNLLLGVGLLISQSSSHSHSSKTKKDAETSTTGSMLLSKELRGVLRYSVHRWVGRMSGSNLVSAAVGLSLLVDSCVYTYDEVSRGRVDESSKRTTQQSIDNGGYTIRINNQSDIDVVESTSIGAETSNSDNMIGISSSSYPESSSLSSSSSLQSSHFYLAKPFARSTDEYHHDQGAEYAGLEGLGDDLGFEFGLGDTTGYNSRDTNQQLHDLHKVVESKKVEKRRGYANFDLSNSNSPSSSSFIQRSSSNIDGAIATSVLPSPPGRTTKKRQTEQMHVLASLTSEQIPVYMQVLADHGIRREALLKAPVVHDALFQRIDSILSRDVGFDRDNAQHYLEITNLLSSLVQLELLWSDLSSDIRQGINRALCVLIPVNWSRTDSSIDSGINVEEDVEGMVDGKSLLDNSMNGQMIAAELAWTLGALRAPKQDTEVRRRGLTLVSALFAFSEDQDKERQNGGRGRFLKELSCGEYARVLLALSGLGWSWREGWGTTNEDQDRRNVLRRAISLHGAQAFGWGPSFSVETETDVDTLTGADISTDATEKTDDDGGIQSVNVNVGNIRRSRPSKYQQSASASELLAVIVGLHNVGCRWTSLNRGFREAMLDAVAYILDADSSKGEKKLILTVTTIMPFLNRLGALETISSHIADRMLVHMAYLMDGLSIPQLVLMLPIIETINASNLRTKEVLLKQYISIALQGHSVDMLVMESGMGLRERDAMRVAGMNMGLEIDMDNSKYPSPGEGFTIAHLVQVTRCLLSLDGAFEFPGDMDLGVSDGMNMNLDEEGKEIHLQRDELEGDSMDMDIRLQYMRHCGSLMRRFSPDEILLILQAFKLLKIRWCDFLLPVHRQTIWESVRDASALLSPEDGSRLREYLSSGGSGGDMDGFGLPRPLMDQLEVELRKKIDKTRVENSVTKRQRSTQRSNNGGGRDVATRAVHMNSPRDTAVNNVKTNINTNNNNTCIDVDVDVDDVPNQSRHFDSNVHDINNSDNHNNSNNNNDQNNDHGGVDINDKSLAQPLITGDTYNISAAHTKHNPHPEVEYYSSSTSSNDAIESIPLQQQDLQQQKQQQDEEELLEEPLTMSESQVKVKAKVKAKVKEVESGSDRRLRVMSQATKKLREVLPKVQHTSFPNTLLLCAALGFDVDSMRREGLWGVVDERLAASVSSWVANDKKLSMTYNALDRLRVKGPREYLVSSRSVRPGLSTGTTLVLLRATAAALDTAKPRTVSNVLYYCARMDLPANRLPSFVSAVVRAFERTAINMDGPGEIARAIYSLAPNTGLPRVQGATKEIYRPRVIRAIGEALIVHEYDLNTKDIIMIFDALRRLNVRYNEFNEYTQHAVTRIIESFYSSSMDSMIKSRDNDSPDGGGSGISLMLYCLGYIGVPLMELSAPSRLLILTTTVARMRIGSAREFFWGLVGLSYMLPTKNSTWQYSQLPLNLRKSVDLALRRHAGSPSLRRHSIAGTFRALNSLGVRWSELSHTARSSLCKALLRLVSHEHSFDSDNTRNNSNISNDIRSNTMPLSAKAWKSLFMTLQQVDCMCEGDWSLVLGSAKEISNNGDGSSTVDELVSGITGQFEHTYRNNYPGAGNYYNNRKSKEKSKSKSVHEKTTNDRINKNSSNNNNNNRNGKDLQRDYQHELHRKIELASYHLNL